MNKFLRQVLLVCVCLFAFTGQAMADSQKDAALADLAYTAGNYGEAVKLYSHLAEQGNADAQYHLGTLYAEGKGVSPDYKEAMKWFRKAAEQGNSLAQWKISLNYIEGRGIAQNHVLAHMWLNISAAKGNSLARESRDSLATIMTSTQISEAQKLARECEKRNYKKCG